MMMMMTTMVMLVVTPTQRGVACVSVRSFLFFVFGKLRAGLSQNPVFPPFHPWALRSGHLHLHRALRGKMRARDDEREKELLAVRKFRGTKIGGKWCTKPVRTVVSVGFWTVAGVINFSVWTNDVLGGVCKQVAWFYDRLERVFGDFLFLRISFGNGHPPLDVRFAGSVDLLICSECWDAFFGLLFRLRMGQNVQASMNFGRWWVLIVSRKRFIFSNGCLNPFLLVYDSEIKLGSCF